MTQAKLNIATLAATLLFASPIAGMAAAPAIQTEGTVIYLADNLNEEANLGWCIDTQGRGFGEKLHAHSCKPTGGDVQFSFDEESGKIESVAFEGKCMTLSEPANKDVPFGLLDCVDADVTQQFIYDTQSMEFRPQTDNTKCVAVAEPIIQAGPFQSRFLILAPCADLSPAFKQWIVRE